MTNSLLHAIQGLVVTKAEVVHDYIQLAFGDEIGLSIYSAITVTPQAIAIDELIGKIVIAVAERADVIRLKFSGEMNIEIDLRPQAYRGPEALQLNRKGLPPVIWN